MQIGPVLRSATGTKIKSNNQGSGEVTIKQSRVLCRHYHPIKSIFSAIKVRVHQCTSIQCPCTLVHVHTKNNIFIYTCTRDANLFFSWLVNNEWAGWMCEIDGIRRLCTSSPSGTNWTFHSCILHTARRDCNLSGLYYLHGCTILRTNHVVAFIRLLALVTSGFCSRNYNNHLQVPSRPYMNALP